MTLSVSTACQQSNCPLQILTTLIFGLINVSLLFPGIFSPSIVFLVSSSLYSPPTFLTLLEHTSLLQHYCTDHNRTMKSFVVREALGVLVWSLTAYVLRMSFSLLASLASLRNNDSSMEDTCDNNQRDTFGVVSQELNTILSVVAGWALSVLPSKVATNTAPGFSFASSW